MSDPKEISRMCKVFSVDKRVQIIRLLAQHPLCVGALANLLDISAGAVSQHLRILRDAGLVESERRGYHIHYMLNKESVKHWQELISEIFTEASGNMQICEPKEGGKQCVKKSRNANTRKS